MDLNKDLEKTNYITANDLQATYSLYPGCPATASSLLSPVSRTPGGCLLSSFPECEFPTQWNPSISSHDTKYPLKSESGRFTKLETVSASKLSQGSNFFCPATFAQFYLDENPLPPLSVSRESDVYSNGGNEHHNRQNKTCKQDVEEIEAYRASFGFSADEIIIVQYVEISDILFMGLYVVKCQVQAITLKSILLSSTKENELLCVSPGSGVRKTYAVNDSALKALQVYRF
ncbi:Uncharacterized protein LOK49_LG08G00018 [Camellia lanceoleosa]|uniref:Uncharacterized protein n=1 Tax=Camellia lanceoleosa TaxID=1840588 RepID=A0ACC0GSB9_9ERIC|nr:Uncharacterized protein LOK49_LG08G00018 [Camellia lanceoleosa]